MGKNRTMEAKRIKYIRQSKARPRSLRMNYGQMKVGQSVDRSKIPQEYMGLFAYRERAKIDVLEDFLSAKFPHHTNNRQPQQIESKPTVLHTVFVETRFVKTVMVSELDEHCFYFIEFHTIPGLLRQSITYGSRDRALHCYEQRSLRWVETVQIPNVEQLR